MNSCAKIVWIIVTFLITFAGLATADEVRLKNGDLINGSVVRMSEKELVFQTEYAGEINIKWSDIAGLTTTEPIRVVLADGTRVDGTVVTAEEDLLQISSDTLQTPVVFKMSDVKQINPEEKPPVQVTARVNAGLSIEDGNTDTENYNIDAEFLARTEKSRYRVGGEWNNEKTDDVDTSKNWLAYANYDFFFTQKWFLFINTLLENDAFADLDLRTTLGGGIGYQIFESELLNLSLAVGPSYVDENFILAADNSFSAGQWLVNYDQYFFEKAFQLFHRNNGYVRFNDTENWLVKTRQGVRFPLYKGLTVTLQYNYDYNNQPSPGAQTKWDWKLLFLLGYRFEN